MLCFSSFRIVHERQIDDEQCLYALQFDDEWFGDEQVTCDEWFCDEWFGDEQVTCDDE
jgi:hypothetical protein